MAAFLPVQTSIIILGVIAGLYTFITVILLVCVCCLCYRKRKARSVSPKADYLSPPTSDNELEPGSSAVSSRRTSTTDASTNSVQQLPSRYRPKGKKKGQGPLQAITTYPNFEGVRESPVLRQRDAWSIENSKPQPDSYSNPRTPDSGLAPSLGESSKYGEPFTSEQARSETPSSVRSSKESNSTGDNEDVFGEKIADAPTNLSRSFEETKRELRRRAPKAVRTESTTPLMDDDSNDLRSPSSDMEFDLKAILPPIKERKTVSPDSLEGSFFVNQAAIAHCDANNDLQPSAYTELKDQPLRDLPPLQGVSGEATGLPSGSAPLVRSGLLPPLFPPGHSQENLNDDKNEQTSAV